MSRTCLTIGPPRECLSNSSRGRWGGKRVRKPARISPHSQDLGGKVKGRSDQSTFPVPGAVGSVSPSQSPQLVAVTVPVLSRGSQDQRGEVTCPSHPAHS